MFVAEVLEIALDNLLGAAAYQRRGFLSLLQNVLRSSKPAVPLFYLLSVLVLKAFRVVLLAGLVYLLTFDLLEQDLLFLLLFLC